METCACYDNTSVGYAAPKKNILPPLTKKAGYATGKARALPLRHTLSLSQFQQHVTFPIHESGNTLDLLMSRVDDISIVNYSVEKSILSKHHFAKCTVRYAKPPQK